MLQFATKAFRLTKHTHTHTHKNRGPATPPFGMRPRAQRTPTPDPAGFLSFPTSWENLQETAARLLFMAVRWAKCLAPFQTLSEGDQVSDDHCNNRFYSLSLSVDVAAAGVLEGLVPAPPVSTRRFWNSKFIVVFWLPMVQ